MQSNLHIGQRNWLSLANVATILVRHSRQIVCEQGRSFGVWRLESKVLRQVPQVRKDSLKSS